MVERTLWLNHIQPQEDKNPNKNKEEFFYKKSSEAVDAPFLGVFAASLDGA